MSTFHSEIHHVVKVTWIDAAGAHDGGVALVHKSRNCSNCAHDGARDAEWRENDGIRKYGRCMNGCGAANDAEKADQWCDEHKTPGEFASNIRRPHTPVFAVVKGGAA